MSLINELKDVFDLVNDINRIIKESNDKGHLSSNSNYSHLSSNSNYSQLASSGDCSKLASSGYHSKLSSSGDCSKLASSGYYSKLASSGHHSQLASSGDHSQLASSGHHSQLASSGDCSKLASSGDCSKLASSGYRSKLSSSGDDSKLASSGDGSQLASSGDCSQLESTGVSSVLSNIGVNGVLKAAKDSWVTLAYFEESRPVFVKTEFVDGMIIKPDTYYCLYKKEFKEVLFIDNIKTAILKKKGSVYKVWILGESNESFLVEDEGVFSHGKTLKEARDSLIYKIGDRDKSKYEDYTKSSKVTKSEAILMYRVITGACEYGVKNFVEGYSTKRRTFTVEDIIDLTDGQYGSDVFKSFFENKS